MAGESAGGTTTTGAGGEPGPRLSLDPETASAGLARRWLARQLGDFHGDLADTAVLLTSEVVTNAVLHARTPIELAVRVRPGRVRVEVADRSPVLPMPKHYDASAVTGRGLVLLEALATHWGVEAGPSGKVVWFDLTESPLTESRGAAVVSPDLAEAWPELEQPMAEAPPALSALVSIRLVQLPVQLLHQASEHSDALLREFRLILERTPGEGRAIPGRLVTVIDELSVRYAGFTTGSDRSAQEAYERGEEAIDLDFELPVDAGEAARRLDELLDDADAYCRAGVELLTLAESPGAAAVRKWFLDEFGRQAAGQTPIPWPESSWAIGLSRGSVGS